MRHLAERGVWSTSFQDIGAFGRVCRDKRTERAAEMLGQDAVECIMGDVDGSGLLS